MNYWCLNIDLWILHWFNYTFGIPVSINDADRENPRNERLPHPNPIWKTFFFQLKTILKLIGDWRVEMSIFFRLSKCMSRTFYFGSDTYRRFRIIIHETIFRMNLNTLTINSTLKYIFFLNITQTFQSITTYRKSILLFRINSWN